ncbi:MAG TPA: metallophosphoesterase [Bryobacteraceae bacterium]|nr:metallophosphoesterase [Bryobacteraceae bacterium]
MRARFIPLLFLAFAYNANAQKFYTYVLDLGPDYVQLGWGTTAGENTIGRSSPSFGDATVEIANRKLIAVGNSITVAGLTPDHSYKYTVSLHDKMLGQGEVRTWAAKSQTLTFFLIGDFGTGKGPEYSVARAMLQEFQRRAATANPVRFLLSVGDNVYGDVRGMNLGFRHTGSSDEDWGSKFFEPYEPLLAQIPFFPSLGNHDGNESERHRDMDAILDNFAFPQNKPGRYYDFNYGGLAQFFALDSTSNTESGTARPGYLEDSPQFHWMQTEFAKPHPLWVIPFFHHPMFTAGPDHPPSLEQLRHWFSLFVNSGVKVVFSGHEHNFQASEVSAATGGIRFFVSGAGGELRKGNVQKNMKNAHIEAWADQNHFLEVDIDGKTMKVTPMSYEPLNIIDHAGASVPLPFVVNLP